jgi:hypothetical protein
MFRLFKFIGFIFSWVIPFVIIFYLHINTVGEQWDIDMLGLLFLIAGALYGMKAMDKQCDVWKIQNRYVLLRHNWSNGKKVLLIGGLTWCLFTVGDTLENIKWTALFITVSFVTGWFFGFLGNIKQNKMMREVYPQG